MKLTKINKKFQLIASTKKSRRAHCTGRADCTGKLFILYCCELKITKFAM